MRELRHVLRGVGVLLGLSLVGCVGGDDGGGGGSFSSGLPADQQLSEVSEDDLVTACRDFAVMIEGVVSGDQSRANCTVMAVQTLAASGEAPTEAACEAEVQRCMQNPPDDAASDMEEVSIDCDSSDATEGFVGCSATVGELETCLNAAIAEARSLLSLIDCATLTDPEMAQQVAQGGSDPFGVPECEALNAECPGAVGGSDEVSSGEPAANGCTDTCEDADDGFCDDGGDGSDTSICALGTDCTDCGAR